MKKVSIICLFVTGLTINFIASAQDQTFANLDFLADYPIQHVDYQCVLALANDETANEWRHADCTIDALERTCLDENASMAEGREAEQCSHIAYLMWDAKLNEYYGRLQDLLPADGQLALQEAQRSWLAFHESDGSSLSDIWQLNDSEAVGTVALLLAQSYQTSAIRSRTRQLYEMLSFLELTN